jgi:hypothetical protein
MAATIYAHRSRESDKRGLAECEVLTFLKYRPVIYGSFKSEYMTTKI